MLRFLLQNLTPPIRVWLVWLGSLLRRILTPAWLSSFVLLLVFPQWWGSLERLPRPAPHVPPRSIPVLAIPMMVTRGATLLATLAALDVHVDTLLLCSSAPGAPEIECVADEVAALAARGALPVGDVRVVFPRAGRAGGAPGPVYGVSECWNALAREAFLMDAARVPWALVMNDDVGFSAGTLGVSVAAVWESYKGKSLLLANDGLPGVGYAFSAFALTREGFAALGSFDENFFPAYYEDCDYIRRADLLPSLPWAHVPWLRLLHPIHKYLPTPPALSAHVLTCMAEAEPARRDFAAAAAGGAKSLLDRAHSPTAWAAFPFSDRHYFAKKWGGALNQCGRGVFSAPFGRDGAPLDEWAYDPDMRRETIMGSALEGLRAPVHHGKARPA